MKDFKLNQRGDVFLDEKDIQYIEGMELIGQKVRQVLLTQIGEWGLDQEEGIDHYSMLTKNPNYDYIEDNVKLALLQVDEDLEIESFSCEENKQLRKLLVNFSFRKGEYVASASINI